MNRIALAALAGLCLTACKSESPSTAPAAAPSAPAAEAPKAEAAAAPATGTKVGDLPVVVDVPAGAVANEGAPGFHSDDGAYSVMIKQAADTDPADLAAAKKATEEVLFKKWNKAEKTADGWVMNWDGVGMDMSGKEYTTHAFSVRRKLGDANYDCYGSVKDAANVEKNVKLCLALKAE